MVIDYKITGRCNANCKFCWDFCKGVSEVSTDEIVLAMHKFKGIANTISLTGGEPLVVKGIDKIIKLLHEMEYSIYLSTNGIELKQHVESICKNVDILGLPVDSIDNGIQSKMGRVGNMLELTLENIKLIKKYNPQITIKVGTVCSQFNYDTLSSLGKILFDNGVDYWRVYQFTAYDGKSLAVAKDFKITDEIFQNVRSELNSLFFDKVSFLSSKDTQDSYWFITPDLYLAKLDENKHKLYSNILDMSNAEIKLLLDEDEIVKKNSITNRMHLTKL